jgi:ATP phosphoribosyltransferase regulatory subunit HisZ
MGAWGTGFFDNDGALDFLNEVDAKGWQAASIAFAQVRRYAQDYLDVDIGSAGLAAAALVAARLSEGDDQTLARLGLHQDAKEALDKLPALPGGLKTDGHAAVTLIATDGELVELWAEATPKDNHAFQASIALLLRILAPR